jgi:uncharacterized membrane protein
MKILLKYKQISILISVVVLLWIVRVAATGTLRVGYLTWNIFLAIVPIILSELWSKYVKPLRGVVHKIGGLVTGLLWVLFLPNAFYIITDFMHLNPDVLVNMRGNVPYRPSFYLRGDGLFVYDSMLIFIATIIGLYFGGLALCNVYRWAKKLTSRATAVCLLSSLIVLNSCAVYVGRFGRWNSWDALYRPWLVAVDFAHTLANSDERSRLLPIFVAICVAQLLSFWAIYSGIVRSPNTAK